MNSIECSKRSKRRIDTLYSPTFEEFPMSAKKNSKRSSLSLVTKKKLTFFNSPMISQDESFDLTKTLESTVAVAVDENSCDSGFSEMRDDDLDSMLTDNDVSFEVHEMFASKLFSNSPVCTKLESLKSSNYELVQMAKKESKFNDFEIIKALEKVDEKKSSDERLIGDLSKTHVLPILSKSKHNDLASITADTLVDLLNGQYEKKIGKYLILDARYPYEYQGGHIHCAESAYNKEALFDRLFKEPMTCDDGKQVVIIFHCEFSSERGPKLMRELRERDRLLNKNNYPNLYYPEIYLLENGYKAFFEEHDYLCFPRSYLPMVHDDHKNDLKFFRKKSKTWELETRKRVTKTKLSF